MHTYMHTYMHTHTHTYRHTCIHTYLYTGRHAYTCPNICLHMFKYICRLTLGEWENYVDQSFKCVAWQFGSGAPCKETVELAQQCVEALHEQHIAGLLFCEQPI